MSCPSPGALIFPDSDSGRVMSENRFLVARDGLGYAKERCTPHGFRSSFRDWAANPQQDRGRLSSRPAPHQALRAHGGLGCLRLPRTNCG